jgi:hypothetical protein
MNQSNFDIKTFSAENIRIKQEKQRSQESQTIYEALARTIYEITQSSPCVTSITKRFSVPSEYMKDICLKFTKKGFVATYKEISMSSSLHEITISWNKN